MERHLRESAPARSPSASSAERALPTQLASYPRTRYPTTDKRDRERVVHDNSMDRWRGGGGGGVDGG